MAAWQKFMNQGNQLFTHQKWNDALGYYHKAITLLETEITANNDDTNTIQQAVQGWICGHHNIASTYEQQGLISLSRDALLAPFHYMLALAANPNVSLALKVAANSALKITLPPLLLFANNHPSEFTLINKIVEQLNHNDRLGHSIH